MPEMKQDDCGLWRVVLDCGNVYRSGLTNAQAWRTMDILLSDPVSASEVQKEYKEKPPEATLREKQEFYSGLIHIGISRNYLDGWAWHKFHEKFRHGPEGLSNFPCLPSKSVWGWVNRKAIRSDKASRK